MGRLGSLNSFLHLENKPTKHSKWRPSKRRCKCSSSTRRTPLIELSRPRSTRRTLRPEPPNSKRNFKPLTKGRRPPKKSSPLPRRKPPMLNTKSPRTTRKSVRWRRSSTLKRLPMSLNEVEKSSNPEPLRTRNDSKPRKLNSERPKLLLRKLTGNTKRSPENWCSLKVIWRKLKNELNSPKTRPTNSKRN